MFPLWAAALALGACSAPEPAERPPAHDPVAARNPDAPVAPSAVSPPVELHLPDGPNAAWTFADSMDDFHQIWTKRFAMSGGPPLAPDALLPYADAIEFQGAAWSIVPDEIIVLLFRDDGSARHIQGIEHPAADERRKDISSDARKQLLSQWGFSPPNTATTPRIDGLQLLLSGPIRFGGTCSSCHEAAAGHIAGAILYRFTEIPDD